MLVHFQLDDFKSIHIRHKERQRSAAHSDKYSQDQAYERWDGTLYGRRLKRKPADASDPKAYVPGEFREHKAEDTIPPEVEMISARSRIQYDDDAKTVNTVANENYFIANDRSLRSHN